MKICSIIKNVNERLALREDKVRRVWEDYFEDLYNMDNKEGVAIHMCGFEGVQKGTYFREELIKTTEVVVKVGILKKGKAAGKDESTGEIKKDSDRMDLEVVQYGL